MNKEIKLLRNSLKMYVNTLNECLEKEGNDSNVLEIMNSMMDITNKYNKILNNDKLVNDFEIRLLNTNMFEIHLPIDNIKSRDILGFYPVNDKSIAVNIYDTVNLPIFELEKHFKNKELLKNTNIIVEYFNSIGVVQYKKIYHNISLENYQQATPNTYKVCEPRVFTVVFNYENVELIQCNATTNQ